MFNHAPTSESNPIEISGVPSDGAQSPVLSIAYVAVIPFRQLAERAKLYMYADRAADDSNILALGLPVASSLATLYRECLD